MVGALVLASLAGALVTAFWAARSHLLAEHAVGSAAWNARQLELREALERREDDVLRERYTARLRAQRARGIYADEEERRRAYALKLHDDLFEERERRALRERGPH